MTQPVALTPIVTKFLQWLVTGHMKDNIDTNIESHIYPCTHTYSHAGGGFVNAACLTAGQDKGELKKKKKIYRPTPV